MPYQPRTIDREIAERLHVAGALVIEGPKACGKTMSARQLAASEVLMDIDDGARAAAAIDPSLVLAGPRPRLIDEWQVEPRLWDHVRRAVDDTGSAGAFILTGSAVPADDITRHTGAGRISRVRMRPMSLYESGHSSGAISLGALLAGEPARSPESPLGVVDIVDRICHGGWPAMQSLTTSNAIRAMRDYVDEIRRTDITRVDGKARDPERVGRLLRAYARSSATHASAASLATDAGGADGALDADTARDYIAALHRLMVVEDVPAWAPHLRSRSRVRDAAKRHFVDPALAVAAIGATPDSLMKDLNYTGFLFESLVVRDLRIYAQSLDARILQYRDNTNLEVDAIIETARGAWAAVEIKLGTGYVDAAAASLLKFRDKVDTSKSGAPSALIVLTGSGYGYTRPDGVSVVPIGALGP